MSDFNQRQSTTQRRREMRDRMIRETEAFLSPRVNARRTRQFRGDRSRDGMTDPRPPATPTRPATKPATSMSDTWQGILVSVPMNEHGHLSDELLAPWKAGLSRLLQTSHRGNVLLDLAEVKTATHRFVQVYDWLRQQLREDGRTVLLHINGFAWVDPDADELPHLIRLGASAD